MSFTINKINIFSEQTKTTDCRKVSVLSERYGSRQFYSVCGYKNNCEGTKLPAHPFKELRVPFFQKEMKDMEVQYLQSCIQQKKNQVWGDLILVKKQPKYDLNTWAFFMDICLIFY